MKNKCIVGRMSIIVEASNKFLTKKIKDERLPILQNHTALFDILPEDGSKLLFNEIASTWKISKSSLSDIINKYESQGLINKCMCSEDKRSVYISLTPEAVVIKQRLQVMEREFLDIILKDFGEDEKKVFEDNIDKALKNIIKML
ncbi:MarR family transcriptional regulator [Clostridium beijerinckii]|uniref:DNA-binding MarR family transcriptional regulator n=1 Tax=Clostridium beijerinckii TaxID=1520 RepID=A0AAX0B415_CLOBE|nr:MarR family transcriptional regulator [Clostridium beijerinckii]NRT90140.1 DNA-binding MarR family transcriptional regulator [Clostridium beijerinckii]NYC69670.1 DNA-binding MarR family transcriptional regulator [Clostridium beijerinckii]